MPRYRSHGQLDDPFVEEGDQHFVGLDALTGRFTATGHRAS